MVSTFTPNIQLEEPARGDYVGTWDTPVNANMTLIDLVVGGRTTIGLNNSPVVLASAQYQCKTITFNSTLTGNVLITFPTSFTKSYEIQNACTGSSAFVITLGTTAAGGQIIGVPPGEIVDVINDGTNIKFRNLGRVGEFCDYVGTAVPGWVSVCTVPPYLYCNGTTFSSATYPALTVILGGTTLPDAAGRTRFSLNDGTGRLTSAGAGINGNTNLASGGNNGVTLAANQIPTITSSGTISIGVGANNIPSEAGFAITNAQVQISGASGSWVPQIGSGSWGTLTGLSGANSMTYTNGAQQIVANAPPGYVGGITMIRAG